MGQRTWLIGLIVAALLVVAIAGTWWLSKGTNPQPLQAMIAPPEGTQFAVTEDDGSGPAVVSPDGSALAFVARDAHGARQIWVRPLAEARALSGTANATYPFWSPDSKWLGFFADGKLKRIGVAEGGAFDICSSGRGRGGAWGPDGTIVFARSTQEGLFRVSARGGEPVAVTHLSPEVTTHRWPVFLKDGKRFLYLGINHSNPVPSMTNGIYVGSIDGKENRFLTPSDASPVYAAGYLFLVRDGAVVAQKLDERTSQLTGDPVSIANKAPRDSGTWRSDMDASPAGVLVYHVASADEGVQLRWFSREGKPLATIGERGRYTDLRLSPDNRYLIVKDDTFLWLLDMERGTKTRFTFEFTADGPAWSPDGKYVYYTGQLDKIYRKLAQGAGEQELIYDFPDQRGRRHVNDVSPDGKWLIYDDFGDNNMLSLWLLPLDGEKKTRQLFPAPTPVTQGRFSPDGRWIAYSQLNGNHWDLFVTSVEHGGRWQISTVGGWGSKWRKDGRAIYFQGSDRSIMETPIEIRGTELQAGTPKRLFNTDFASTSFWSIAATPTSDGSRFVARTVNPAQGSVVGIIVNWQRIVEK